MTLISFTSNPITPGQSVPILMSDILLTSKHPASKSQQYLPAFPGGTDEIPFQAKPTDLRQKIHIISDNLAIACAGKVGAIYGFLLAATNRFANKIVTEEEVRAFVMEAGQIHEEKGVDALLVVFEHPSKVKKLYDGTFGLSVLKIGKGLQNDSSKFGKVFATGTGAERFMQLIDFRTMDTTTWVNDFSTDQILQLQSRALRSNFTLFGDFTTGEVASNHNLLQGWGAGYELAFLNNKDYRFQKFDDYTFILFGARFSNNKLSIEPRLMIKHKYQGEVLQIQSTNFKDEDRRFTLGKIYPSDSNFADFAPMPYKAETILYSVLLPDRRPGVLYNHLTSCFNQESGLKWVTFELKKGKWIPRLHVKEKQRLESEICKLFKTKRPRPLSNPLS